VSVRNCRGKEKWIQGIVRVRTGAVSYQVEIAPNRLSEGDTSISYSENNIQYFELATDIHVLANENRGRTQDFSPNGSKAYMPKKNPNIQRIINNVILKIVNIVFSKGGQWPPPPPRCVRP
jgi:phage repressor protein C with HTH and peptisase S24 domain